ncbi:hypothetical protein CDAR_34791 [Caerostris darwini]|uniref:Maturase K n=1 Tax=Caerostris darwini TaxID=1538125 RepID=A0AAV4RXA9_9ARAC|nr:hypothetical protein CDAR_34791 [Caerostris darwini]
MQHFDAQLIGEFTTEATFLRKRFIAFHLGENFVKVWGGISRMSFLQHQLVRVLQDQSFQLLCLRLLGLVSDVPINIIAVSKIYWNGNMRRGISEEEWHKHGEGIFQQYFSRMEFS